MRIKTMPPKVLPVKNAPTTKPSAKGDAKGAPKSAVRGVKGGPGKKANKKPKRRQLNLKGWLKTKADWEKFDNWAKINAQPRKIPEPEPIVRPSKPLSKMKKSIAILSKPHEHPDISKTCRLDLSVSKKALKAKPSKRILQLAMFLVKYVDSCREIPITISRSALRYKASKRIIQISQPRDVYFSEYCKLLFSSEKAEKDRDISPLAKRRALHRKAIECPDLLTDEEINALRTPTGIYRSALEYNCTPWMNYLALPSYRFLKYQTHEEAEKWKKIIIEESGARGKEALEYKRKKAKLKTKGKEEAKEPKEEGDEETREEMQPTVTDSEDDSKNKEAESELPPEEQKQKTTETVETEETNEAKKLREAERNAWRFAPLPCVEDPFDVKKSALKGKVSPRMDELAKPNVHKNMTSRRAPFDVRKGALEGKIPERIGNLAKPNHPRDPVERPAPREKDKFGRPVFPKPAYGKKIPRVKPYQEAECPDKDGTVVEEEKKEENIGKEIDPVVYEATIDPFIDPEGARKQLKARNAAKEESLKRKRDEENKPSEGEEVTA